MAHKGLVVALSAIIAASPVSAATPQPDPGMDAPTAGAPAAPADARYCLRVDPITGTRIVTIQCRTREDWASLEVDVDKEWADNGVRILPG